MRDKYLTEAMGYGNVHINECGQIFGVKLGNINSMRESVTGFNGFSTWAGFGKLWEWAQKQYWWGSFSFKNTGHNSFSADGIIHPDRFADAVYNFLKDK